MRFKDVLNFLLDSGFGNDWRPWRTEQFSERLGVCPSTVYLWRSGHRSRPRPDNLENISELLGLDAFFSEVLYRSAHGSLDVVIEELNRRRDILRGGSATVGNGKLAAYVSRKDPLEDIPLLPSALEDLRGTLVSVIGSGASFSNRGEVWRQVVLGYAKSFRVTPPKTMTIRLIPDLSELQSQVAKTKDEAERTSLLYSLSMLAGIMALVQSDLYQLPAALRWWEVALDAADHSKDTFALAWILGQMSREQIYTFKAPEEALALSEKVMARAPSTYGEAYSVRAMAYARMRRPKEARQAIEDTERVLESMQSQIVNDTQTIFGWPEERLRFAESYVYSHLGDARRARRAQAQVRSLYGRAETKAVNRTIIDIHDAICMAREGYIDDGCQAAIHAVQFLGAYIHSGTNVSIRHEVVQSRYIVESLQELLDDIPSEHRRRPLVLTLASIVAEEI